MNNAHITLYGIKNCDTVKKAQKWLSSNNITPEFHDYKQQGIDEQTIHAWLDFTPWETLFNKRSTTYRALSDSDKQNLDQAKAIRLMVASPTLIKRPVIRFSDQILVGFNESEYQNKFLQNE